MTKSGSREKASSKCHVKTSKGCPQPDTCLLEPTILSRLVQRVEEQTGAQVEML
jgi:hypothetical protein